MVDQVTVIGGASIEVHQPENTQPLLIKISGAAGPPGPAGQSFISVNEVEVTAPVSGQQDVALPSNPSDVQFLFINGLAQLKTAYTVAGTTLTLPASLNVVAGDVIRFAYF